jgi:hypothetical protein
MIVFLNKYYSVDRIRPIKMTRVGHVTRMRRREVHKGFWWENLKEKGHLEGLGIDGRIILKWIINKWNVSMVQNRNRRRAVVSAVRNIRCP